MPGRQRRDHRDLCHNEPMRIGVDVGGTKIEGILIDDDGREQVRRRIPTPAGDYGATIAAIAGIVEELEMLAGDEATVGIGHPGAMSPVSGLLKNSNSTALNGKPFDRDLQAAIGRPVALANDADCFALSEATDGAGEGFATVFGVILGTGVGGGIVVNGALVRGPSAIAGEWGHNPLPWPEGDERPGPACYCGKHGCIETFLSGPGMARDFARHTGTELTSREIVERARRGDADAVAALDRYIDRAARSLATIIDVLDPHVIVLGGGMSNIDELYTGIPERLPAWVFGGEVGTEVRRNVHGDSSGVRGAAWLGPPQAGGHDPRT